VQSFILQSRNGAVIGEVPDHAKASFESIEKAIKEDTTADALRRQREEEQALQRLETAQENLTLAKMLQEFQMERTQRAAEQAAMLRRANQINQINQMNIIMGLFNTFVFNSNL
jgi:DNA/RNA-binding domain of Phe-tRNA-synthetase-like protein